MDHRLMRQAVRSAIVLGTVLCLVAPAVTTVTAAPATRRRSSAAIDWKVDYAAKTITVTVRVVVSPNEITDIYQTLYPSPRHEQAWLEAARRIEADIRRVWSGLTFKCFKFIVEPHVRSTFTHGAQADEIPVELDAAIYPGGTGITGEGRPGSAQGGSRVIGVGTGSYLSDAPSDRVDQFDGSTPVTSVWPFYGTPGTYAHEFGHFLGLDDNFNPVTGELRSGAAPDLMYRGNFAVSPETVTKVIRRSGEVDESTIKCPFTIDHEDDTFGLPMFIAAGVQLTIGFHAWACDYDPPSTDSDRRKPIEVNVKLRLSGGVNAGPFGSGTGSDDKVLNVSIPPPPGSVGDRARLVIPLPADTTLQTPLRFTQAGLAVDGFTRLEADGGSLPLPHAAELTEGAKECE